MLPEDPVDTCKIPARIIGSGMVTAVDKERHSFLLYPTQRITASEQAEAIPVRAVLEKGPKWPNPVARLPSPYNFVGFTGKLAHFEENTGKIRNDLQNRVVVTLDSITYLRATYATNVSSNATVAQPSTSRHYDPDSVALKTRVLKYSSADAHDIGECVNTGIKQETDEPDT